MPIISALEYNTWFTKLRANHVRLSHDNIEKILHVLKKSLSLEELYLDNLGLKADFVNKLTNSIKANAIIPLNTIDLSNNMIEDKGNFKIFVIISNIIVIAFIMALILGANYLSNCITHLNKGPVYLNLSHCGLTAKGVNQLSQSLIAKTSAYTTLTYLNLSGNSLKDDISVSFYLQ